MNEQPGGSRMWPMTRRVLKLIGRHTLDGLTGLAMVWIGPIPDYDPRDAYDDTDSETDGSTSRERSAGHAGRTYGFADPPRTEPGTPGHPWRDSVRLSRSERDQWDSLLRRLR